MLIMRNEFDNKKNNCEYDWNDRIAQNAMRIHNIHFIKY